MGHGGGNKYLLSCSYVGHGGGNKYLLSCSYVGHGGGNKYLLSCSYVGHGGGNKYLSGESLQTTRCRAVALLMGCSSGKLTTAGQLDASGLMLNYFLGGW